MWVSALKLGYSRQELSVMPFGEIIFDLAAMNDGSPKQEQEQDPDVVDATQDDIRTMLG